MKHARFVLLTAEYAKKGGIGAYFRALMAAGWQADVVVTRLEEAEGEPDARVLRGVDERDRRWLHLISVCRSLWREGYETILITHLLPIGTAAWLASFFRKEKYVVFLHGLDLELSQQSRWKRWLSRQILLGARGVVANSATTEALLKRAIPSITPLRLLPALPGPDLTNLTVGETKSLAPFGEATRVVLTIGRLVSRKGMDTAIKALKHLPTNVHLVILGDGPDRARLEQVVLSEELNERVHFYGLVSEEEKQRWLKAADLFLFLPRNEGPDIEGFGMVCLEAAAAGLPVVVSSEGGAHEAIIPGKTGIEVPARDPEKIAREVNLLLNDDALRRSLGRAGSVWVKEHFSPRDRVQVLAAWLTRL